MPLTRYLIRNEYGLADPELYSAANKDDPEALLEGVAMAGLVGVLRQLGDLAEFATEIFHNLHEEVTTTAARGHDIMVRVQQLETEFPSIEKAFLSQTNNRSFLFNAGIDWHPNLHSEENLISRGDLPRFVMDSYEDCRGPPKLFLLDKFDVAGAGACLKRYSDPSFFVMDPTSSNKETQRESKHRKMKKKGSRWKNGETPDIGPASHVKLQQLLMEERIENGFTNPARVVKLKKRQMSNCGIDSKTGKSYMEKFLETPSPEQKMVCGTTVTLPWLELTSNDIGESGFKMLEISTDNHVLKSPGRDSTSSSCNAQEEVSKSSMDHELTGREIVKVIEPIPDNKLERGHPMSHDMEVENEAVNREVQPQSCVDGYQSDDVISEVDNYMDALNTMESEVVTDSENRSKELGKNITESDENEESLGIEAQFLDPRSNGNSSESDGGNFSFVHKSSFSCSSTVMVDDRADAELFISAAEPQNLSKEDITSNPVPGCTYSQDIIVKELGMSTINDEEKVFNCGVICSESCFSANPSLPHSNSGSTMSMALMVESAVDKTAPDHVGYGAKISKTGADLDEFVVASSDFTSPTSDDTYQYNTVDSERHSVNECNGGDPSVNSDVLVLSQNALDLVTENEPVTKFQNTILQVEYQDENSFESFVDDKLCVSSSSTDEQLFTSVSPEMELLSVDESAESLTILRDFSSDAKSSDPTTSTVDHSIKENEVRLEELTLVSDSPGTKSLCKERFSNNPDDVLRVEAGLVESDVICVEEIKEASRTTDDGDTGQFIRNSDWMGSDTPLDELQSTYPIDLSHVHENCDSAVDITETALQTVIVEPPSTNPDVPCHKDRIELDNLPTQAFCKNETVPAAAIPNTREFDGVDEDSHISLDLMSSSRITKVWEQNQSGVGNQQKNQTAFNEDICKGSDVEPEIKEKDNQLEDLSDLDADCKAVSYDFFNLEGNDRRSVYGFPQVAHNKDIQTVHEACLAPSSLEPSKSELQADSTNLKDIFTFSPPCCLRVLESLVEPFAEVQHNQLQMEHMQDVTAIYNSSTLHESEIIQSHRGSQKCEGIHSSTLGENERYSDTTSKSVPDILRVQSSQAESIQQGYGTSPVMDTQWSFKPSFVTLHAGEQVNLEEMPPLPPLPPMQWRLGKIQPSLPASHRESVEISENHSQSIIQPKMCETPGQFALQSTPGIVQPQNPFLFLETEENEKSSTTPGDALHELTKPISFSLQLPTMFNQADHQYDSLSLDDKQSFNASITIPVAQDEKLEYLSRQEEVESDLIPLQASRIENGILKHSSTNSLEPQNKLLSEPDLISETLQHAPQNVGVEEVNSLEKLEALLMKHEQHQSLLVVEGEGEIASSSTASAMMLTFEEGGKPNGKPPNKIPRPRTPLIDAVAAHDKRLLRKATERILPQVIPKVDERDSMLQQIRTKSFNLKPAVVTRPIIQGPKTNLKVAAILQRATAIRQACAGSDEDDDGDSWSDSD